jgi:hypothetical protein
MSLSTYLLATDGLCNRMRTIDSAITLSTNLKRDLKVIWVRNDLLNSRFNKLFEPIDGIELIETSSQLNYIKALKLNPYPKINPEKKKGITRFLSKALWKLQCMKLNIKGSVFYDELLEISSKQAPDDKENEKHVYKMIYERIHRSMDVNFSNYIASCWRLYPDHEFYARFTPIKSLQERIDKNSSTFSETFGLHIRRTDHKEAIEMSGLDKFIALIEDKIENNDRSTFFLATDDLDTESALKKKFNGRIITTQKTSFSRNSEEGMQNAVVDLYCLSRTKKIYGSFRSSFSQVAADISGIEVKTVS